MIQDNDGGVKAKNARICNNCMHEFRRNVTGRPMTCPECGSNSVYLSVDWANANPQHPHAAVILRENAKPVKVKHACQGQKITADGTFHCDRKPVAAYSWDGAPFRYNGIPGAAVCDEHQVTLFDVDAKYPNLKLIEVLKKPRTIEDLKNDPRVTDISDERGSEDGIWLYLVAGLCSDPSTHQVHEDTVKESISYLQEQAQRTKKSRPVPREHHHRVPRTSGDKIMTIKAEWAEPCPECGALDGCCQSSKDRRDTADSLGNLVDRQSQTITKLTRELQEARQVIADLKSKGVA